MTTRQQALLSYFLDVTRDLVRRGELRQRAGQQLVDILKSEPKAVLAEVSEDFTTVLRTLGVGLVGGLELIGRKWADSLVSFGADALTRAIKKRSGR